MCKTQYKSIYDRYKQSSKGLLKRAGVTDNTATTKLKAVKPNRHSLAIFLPKICATTNHTIITGENTQRHFFARPQIEDMPSYVGLIGGNTRAFKVNTPSRLSAVVTPDAIFHGVKLLTKLKGGH